MLLYTTHDEILSVPPVGVLIRNAVRARHDQERQRAGHHRQNITDIVDGLAAHLHPVHLEHFVALVEQSALFGRATPNYPSDDHRVAVVPHGGALQTVKKLVKYFFY